MIAWQAYPSARTTEINSIPDTVVDPPESIGSPADAAATASNSTNSAFALLKGICAGMNVPAGSGAGVTNTNPKHFGDPARALGEMSDAAATPHVESQTAISLLKGILATTGI